jgi:hypothetical protein
MRRDASDRGSVRFLLIGAAFPLVLLLTYNCSVTHHFVGAYGIEGNAGFFAVFVVATSMSIVVQIVGAFWYMGKGDAVIMASEGDPNRMNFVWDIWNAPFVAELGHPSIALGGFVADTVCCLP